MSDDVGHDLRSGRRSDSLEQLQDAKPGNRVAGILGNAQETEEVLDVGRLQKAQTAVLVIRDVSPGQFNLEGVRQEG